jgi:hypothetical protein
VTTIIGKRYEVCEEDGEPPSYPLLPCSGSGEPVYYPIDRY